MSQLVQEIADVLLRAPTGHYTSRSVFGPIRAILENYDLANRARHNENFANDVALLVQLLTSLTAIDELLQADLLFYLWFLGKVWQYNNLLPDHVKRGSEDSLRSLRLRLARTLAPHFTDSCLSVSKLPHFAPQLASMCEFFLFNTDLMSTDFGYRFFLHLTILGAFAHLADDSNNNRLAKASGLWGSAHEKVLSRTNLPQGLVLPLYAECEASMTELQDRLQQSLMADLLPFVNKWKLKNDDIISLFNPIPVLCTEEMMNAASHAFQRGLGHLDSYSNKNNVAKELVSAAALTSIIASAAIDDESRRRTWGVILSPLITKVFNVPGTTFATGVMDVLRKSSDPKQFLPGVLHWIETHKDDNSFMTLIYPKIPPELHEHKRVQATLEALIHNERDPARAAAILEKLKVPEERLLPTLSLMLRSIVTGNAMATSASLTGFLRFPLSCPTFSARFDATSDEQLKVICAALPAAAIVTAGIDFSQLFDAEGRASREGSLPLYALLSRAVAKALIRQVAEAQQQQQQQQQQQHQWMPANNKNRKNDRRAAGRANEPRDPVPEGEAPLPPQVATVAKLAMWLESLPASRRGKAQSPDPSTFVCQLYLSTLEYTIEAAEQIVLRPPQNLPQLLQLSPDAEFATTAAREVFEHYDRQKEHLAQAIRALDDELREGTILLGHLQAAYSSSAAIEQLANRLKMRERPNIEMAHRELVELEQALEDAAVIRRWLAKFNLVIGEPFPAAQQLRELRLHDVRLLIDIFYGATGLSEMSVSALRHFLRNNSALFHAAVEKSKRHTRQLRLEEIDSFIVRALDFLRDLLDPELKLSKVEEMRALLSGVRRQAVEQELAIVEQFWRDNERLDIQGRIQLLCGAFELLSFRKNLDSLKACLEAYRLSPDKIEQYTKRLRGEDRIKLHQVPGLLKEVRTLVRQRHFTLASVVVLTPIIVLLVVVVCTWNHRSSECLWASEQTTWDTSNSPPTARSSSSSSPSRRTLMAQPTCLLVSCKATRSASSSSTIRSTSGDSSSHSSTLFACSASTSRSRNCVNKLRK